MDGEKHTVITRGIQRAEHDEEYGGQQTDTSHVGNRKQARETTVGGGENASCERRERERNRERGEGRVFGWACYIGRRTVLLQDLPRLRFRIRGISAAAVLSP